MATSDEQAQAVRLLRIHRRNLDRLEVQKAELGGELSLALENQIDEERANIAALEPIANPPAKPSAKVEAFVRQTTPGEIDLMMLYMQGVQLNTRMTKAEDQNQHIIEEQSLGATWRMQTDDRLGRIEVQVSNSERHRAGGATWYRAGLLIAIGVGVLALAMGMALVVRALGS